MSITFPFTKKGQRQVSFRVHADGKAFDVEAQEQNVNELHVVGFETVQGFIGALTAAKRHAEYLGIKTPMKIEMTPSQVITDVVF